MTSSAKKISGKVLQRLRAGHGLVQEEMAERLGKARSSLAGWEAGRGGLNLENLTAFLDQLDVSMEEFGRHFDALRHGEAEGSEDAALPSKASPGRALTPPTRSIPAAGTDEGGPFVLHANRAVVMMFGEQRESEGVGGESVRTGNGLEVWMQDLFRRAERLFPGPEELPETEPPRREDDGEAVAGSTR
jgi:transcriptional regulator with XRE-family HTH domain